MQQPDLNRCVIMELLIHMVLQNSYDAIYRSLLCRLCIQLSVPLSFLLQTERKLLSTISLFYQHLSKDENELSKNARKLKSRGKWWKVAATGIVTGVIAAVAGRST